MAPLTHNETAEMLNGRVAMLGGVIPAIGAAAITGLLSIPGNNGMQLQDLNWNKVQFNRDCKS